MKFLTDTTITFYTTPIEVMDLVKLMEQAPELARDNRDYIKILRDLSFAINSGALDEASLILKVTREMV